MACGCRKRRCCMKFCNAYSFKFSMDSEGRICLLYDFVLRYIFNDSFYEVITNLWLPFSSVFCSSVVLVSVFLFLSNRTWFRHLLLNASSGLCITKSITSIDFLKHAGKSPPSHDVCDRSPVKWNATGCRNLVWVSWRRIVPPLFFLLLQGSKKKPFVSDIMISAWRYRDALDRFFLRARDIRFLERDDIGYHFSQTVSRY